MQTIDEPVIKKLLVVWYSGYEIKKLVVWNRVRPEDLSGEFIDPPHQDKVSEGDEIEDSSPKDRQDYG